MATTTRCPKCWKTVDGDGVCGFCAAMGRVLARGIKKHETAAFQKALREELGVSDEEHAARCAAVEVAADARLARGEAALHAAVRDAKIKARESE